MMECAMRYYCRYCGREKHVPESPLSCPNQIKTGCEWCDGLTPHHPVGQPEVRA